MLKEYWKKTHEIYSKKDWINNTTIFARFAVGYFPKQGKLLDLGAGQGQDSRYFAKLGYDVISTDISDFALKLSKENAKKDGLKLKIIKLDTSEKLHFKDNSFDIVYSHMALHYFTDEKTREVFREIHRILKPNGILACICNTVKDPESKDSSYELIEEDYYKTAEGLLKRYFSVKYMRQVTENLFISLVLDSRGETYKDEIKSLVRFIGKANK